jgi:monomeric isocitrate dehydrogenase
MELHIQDWVEITISRVKTRRFKAISWLKSARTHDANLIMHVQKYLANHNTNQIIQVLTPDSKYKNITRARLILAEINICAHCKRNS